MANTLSPNSYKECASDSAMIQAAVDEAAKIGLSVTIPRINERTGEPIWEIDETINLYSGSTVYLDNCHLRLADDSFCNIFKNSHARTEKGLKISGRQYDIRISGFGNAILDGGKHNGYLSWQGDLSKVENGRVTDEMIRNCSVHFFNAERVTVENVSVVNQRFWGITFHYCSGGRVSNIRFDCELDRINLDGVDVRTGCHDFVIENLSGRVGDDMVALTNLPVDIRRYGSVEGLDNNIHSVVIRNIRSSHTGECAVVRLLNHGQGQQMYNILIDGVMDCSPVGGLRDYATLRIGENEYFGGNEADRAALGSMRGITVRNVVSHARYGAFISCTLQDALFDGIRMFADAGTAVCLDNVDGKNIIMRNIQYGAECKIPEEDRGFVIHGTLFRMDALACMYIHHTKCENLYIDGLSAVQGADAVFAGEGNQIKINLRGLLNASDLPLVSGEGICVESRDA